MTWRGLGRGFFEGPPRVVFRRAGARYIDACAAIIVLNGVAVAVFGVATLAMYLDLSAGELALVFGCMAGAFALEGWLAALVARRSGRPIGVWLAARGDRDAARAAWAATAGLPLTLLRRRWLYLAGVAGAAVTALALAAVLDLPASEAALALPFVLLMYVSSVILRYLGLELAMRPVLRAIGEHLGGAVPEPADRVALHPRLLAAVPLVTWGTGVVVAGLLTENTRDLDTLAPASVVALVVAAALSTWLSLVLADSVSGPISDLRDATRRVADGDLAVRVPVVSTDETGELAASFNAMVAGLDERERLRDAFGSYVDPALTERVLAEGTDLRGEEVEVSILFLDVRDFTAFAEQAPAHEVVATLNRLYELVVPAIERHGGHVNKFIGDGLLAVFGAPQRHADHAARAVAAAREIAGVVSARLEEEVRVGIGVNSGPVVAGTVGGGGRRDFTVIGDAVNTAARVQQATRATGDEILVTEATLRALGGDGDRFEQRPSAPLKGKSEPVRLYAPRARGR
jgi:class 3 adenylate cyclase